jgi:hypothetical protein
VTVEGEIDTPVNCGGLVSEIEVVNVSAKETICPPWLPNKTIEKSIRDKAIIFFFICFKKHPKRDVKINLY